jgi:NAD+ kinase
MRQMRIHLVPNTDNAAACEAARTIATALVAEDHAVTMAPEDIEACGVGADRGGAPLADLVVALGGDGTILKAVHRLAGADVPVLGVNLGRLGFLCGTGSLDPLTAVREAIAGRASQEVRAMLRVGVTLGGRDSGTHEALNEVFIGRSAGARAVDLEVSVSGERLARWVCDGLIVSTATGSTAYALSAGGPLLAPDLRALLVVPVCAHSVSARPVVLSPSSLVTITLPDPARAEACVAVDGDVLPCRTALQRVDVTLDANDVRLLRLDGRGFVAAVRDTFLAG